MSAARLLSRLLPVVVAGLVAGCALERVPLAVDPALRTASIDRILVLPAIDARQSRFDQVQVARNVGDAMVRYLRERGYVAIPAEEYGERPDGPIDLRTATAEQLMPLTPEDPGYFLLVAVERLDPTYDDNGRSYDATLAAALVDGVNRKVVWRDVVTASGNLSGVLTLLTRTTVQYEAAVNAARALVASLPDRREKSSSR